MSEDSHEHNYPLSTGVCECGDEHPQLGPTGVTTEIRREPTKLEQLQGLLRFGMMRKMMPSSRGVLVSRNIEVFQCSGGCGTINTTLLREHVADFTCSDCWKGPNATR